MTKLTLAIQTTAHLVWTRSIRTTAPKRDKARRTVAVQIPVAYAYRPLHKGKSKSKPLVAKTLPSKLLDRCRQRRAKERVGKRALTFWADSSRHSSLSKASIELLRRSAKIRLTSTTISAPCSSRTEVTSQESSLFLGWIKVSTRKRRNDSSASCGCLMAYLITT